MMSAVPGLDRVDAPLVQRLVVLDHAVEVFQTYTLPLLEQRFRYPSAFLEAWADIMKQVENISILVDDLSPGDAVWNLYDIHDAWAVYDEVTHRNLRLQEPVAMILFHSYFSKAEGDKIAKEEVRRMAANSRGLDAIIFHVSSALSVAKALPSTSSLELEYIEGKATKITSPHHWNH